MEVPRRYQGCRDELLGEEDMAERHEERKRLRRMEERQRPKRETRAHQQER